MKGRVYDPTIGRFLSQDPLVQAPTNSQSFNRYSYVWNRALSATDPSGYFTLTSDGGPSFSSGNDDGDGNDNKTGRNRPNSGDNSSSRQGTVGSNDQGPNGSIGGSSGALASSGLGVNGGLGPVSVDLFSYDSISGLRGNSLKGMFKHMASSFTGGIFYGESSSIAGLRGTPQDYVDIEAYRLSDPAAYYAMIIMMPGNKSGAVVTSLPVNGIFSRVMPRKYAEAFARGEGYLGGGTEVFVGAADDLAKVASVANAQKRLSLFTNYAGTTPNLAGDVVVTFKVRDLYSIGLRSPIETAPARGYGFTQGGATGGGAREWLFNNGTASELGIYDIYLRSLK